MSKSKKNKKIKCGSGEILRKGFKRKGFYRNEFVRKDGTIVPASYVPETFVPPTCVPDTGRPGRGKKILPKPNNIIHLSAYGWSVHNPESERHQALRAASNDYGVLKVLQRLNLLRNYQAIPENKEIFTADVEFMKDMYDPYRKVPRRAPMYNVRENKKEVERWKNPNNWISYKKNRTNRRSNRQYGGAEDNEISDTIESSIDADDIETQTYGINTIVDRTKICNSEGKCGVRNVIYEMHEVDGKQIIYYTLGEADVSDILKLDKVCIGRTIDKDSVLHDIQNNTGLLIGIKVDGKLEGYCQYEPFENLEVSIVTFCVNKGYRTALYIFMENYFKMNDYTRIMVDVTLSHSGSKETMNFWYAMDFITYEILSQKNVIHMEKFI
jgi:hypothetical protein